MKISYKPIQLIILALLFSNVLHAESKTMRKTKVNYCKLTAQSALTSCRFDVKEEYFLSKAKCYNNLTANDRSSCRREAKKAYNEGKEECSDFKQARLDLCRDFGGDPYDPEINPANFLTPEEAASNPNPYLMLVPGSIRKYKSGSESIVLTVTSNTRTILGVKTTIVSDVVSINGKTVEDTEDYYAQDKDGNVWYFGERVLNYDEEGYLADLDGSFIAGKDGAKPGIAMLGNPTVGRKYRQEFAVREAEDVAEIIGLAGNETSTAINCNGACLVVSETLPLDPEVVEYKYYVAGVGFILSIDGETGEKSDDLIEITNP